MPVEAYVDALSRRDPSRLGEWVAPDVAGHEPGREIVGIEQLERSVVGWLEAFPQMRLATEDLFAVGDRVAWRWSLSGTHATAKRLVDTSGIIIFRVAQGRIVEYWGQYDRLDLQRQLEDG